MAKPVDENRLLRFWNDIKKSFITKEEIDDKLAEKQNVIRYGTEDPDDDVGEVGDLYVKVIK